MILWLTEGTRHGSWLIVPDPTLSASHIVSIHQPNLFPRVTTITKLLLSSTYVPLTEVQFTQRDYQHRFRITDRLNHEQARWSTVPVHLVNGQKTLLPDVRIVDPQACGSGLFDTLYYHYGTTPGWNVVSDCVSRVCEAIAADNLVEANLISMNFMLELLNWSGSVITDVVQPQCERSMRLARITKTVGGSAYICGSGGKSYLDVGVLRAVGVGVISIDYSRLQNVLGPSWKSRSSIDLLCLSGPEVFRSTFEVCQRSVT